ncbi:S-layer family protein [Microcoleus sp. FACHB-68]|uniref:beta strand repeat-containing protein n=1 Tax=Microcoleus sp. FACHB-68 TaxID=2692826 RepID=UPI001682D994|nr:S-layer family protein [Microcoleus sp. FACHB-68]MBD1938107.1 S-layer family protein [Microcoleus sp. FACHB-68]
MMSNNPVHLALLIGCGMCCSMNFTGIASAQIAPDTTLPRNTTVTPAGNVIQIEGGTQVGSSLFHSFREFSVPTNTEAFFNNAAGIQNIFSRVTGNKISNIDGLIRANGTANLFLLNPNGILFGPNARLNIGGSFMGTTANSIRFAGGSEFSAINPTAPPILTVNVPIGLQLGPNPGGIQVEGPGNQLAFDGVTLATLREDRPAGLQVNAGKTLALIGGNITLIGGNLTAESGRIELGSVAGGTVTLTPTNSGWTLQYPGVENFQDIRLSQAASISSSGTGGGDVQLMGRRITLSEGSAILADTLGDQPGGSLIVRATESVELTSSPGAFSSSLFASVDPGATGNGGNLLIETDHLRVADGAIIGADTFGSGNAGTLTIQANLVELLAGSVVETSVYQGATGQGGNLIIQADRLLVTDGAQVLTFTLGGGDAAQMTVKAREVEITGTSESGRFASVLAASVEPGATGNGGKLTIEAESLRITNGARVGVESLALGNAGEVRVRANLVEVSGTSILGNPSTLSADATDAGLGGDLSLETARLIVRDGGQIATGTLGSRAGGNLNIKASESIELSGSVPAIPPTKRDFFRDDSGQRFPSGLFASSQGTGDAGNLTIETQRLIVGDGAQVSVSSNQTGGAGNLNLNADQIRLDRGTLSAAAAQGNQGNMTLNASELQLQHGSHITTNATGTATGGNITINADTLAALRNSDITANATGSFGGQVIINAQGIFGTEFRPTLTAKSDITASSSLGAQFSGTVQLNTPDVDPASGVVELSEKPVDPNTQIASGCTAARGSSFTATGRGGLPADPTQTLRGTARWQDLRPLETAGQIVEERESGGHRESSLSQFSIVNPQPPIIEATGWIINNKGQMELVAKAPNISFSSSWNQPASCDN